MILLRWQKKKKKNGKSMEMMPNKSFIHPISVKTFLKYTKYNGDINFARYDIKDDEFEIINKINCPLFMRWGNVNEMIKQNAKDLVEFMDKKIINELKDIDYIDGADHGYHGKEEVLANNIKVFLTKICYRLMKKETENKMKKNLAKVTIIIGVVFLLGIIIYLFLPMIKMLATYNGRLAFRDAVQGLGIKGTMLIFLLEFSKMLFVIIPGEPLEIFFGMCFGSIKGTIYLLVLSFISSYFIYTLVNKYQHKILLFFFSEEKVKKIENNKLLKDPDKIENILTWLFLVPGTPKDFIIYIGALLPIPKWKFIMIVTIYRIPSFITSTIAGSGITKSNWMAVIMPYVVLIITSIIIQKIRTINKDAKEIDKVISDIK